MRNRDGVALAVALFALVAVAAIVAAIIAPAIAHRRAVVRAAVHAGATGLAESAIGDVLRDWPRTRWTDMALGTTWSAAAPLDAPLPRIPSGKASARVTVMRHTDAVFSVAAAVIAPALLGPVAVGRTLLVELRTDPVVAAPALTAGGAVEIGDGDVIAIDPVCPPAAGEPAGVLHVPDAALVRWSGADAGDVVEDPAAAEAGTYARAAGLDVGVLSRRADIELPAGARVEPVPEADSSCIAGDAHWGEPLRAGDDLVAACVSRFPIVHAAGDLAVANGRGQGILLVAGRLRITGPFHYSGVIVAAGGIETAGDSVTLTGAVFTGPSAPALFRAARTQLRRSSCAAHAAAQGAAQVAPIRLHPWG